VEITQADAELAVALAKVDVAKETWQLLKEGPDPYKLRVAEAGVADAEAGLLVAQQDLEDIELRAPFDGEILSMGMSPGSQVTAFRSVLTLADPADLEIVAFPSQEDLSALGVDQAAVIQLTSRPGTTLSGHIRQVPFSSSAQSGSEAGDRDLSLRIVLDDPAVELALNEVATIVVQLEVQENVLWLPPGALRTFQGRDFVFIEENGVQRRVDLRLGLRSDDRVEVMEGLSEGQVVVGP
jgi:RND family efflux transporter MFP subunit